MKLVEQEDQSGCAAACVAMLLELSYQEAKQLFPDPSRFEITTLGAGGVAREVLDRVLVTHGYAVARRYETRKPFGFKHIAEVTTPDLYAACNSWHYVVVDCIGRVYDPGDGNLGSGAIYESLARYITVLSLTAIVCIP